MKVKISLDRRLEIRAEKTTILDVPHLLTHYLEHAAVLRQQTFSATLHPPAYPSSTIFYTEEQFPCLLLTKPAFLF